MAIPKLTFRALIKIQGANPYVIISAARAAKLRTGRRAMPVLVRINGKPEKPWRINTMPRGDGSFYLYLHGAVRKASGTKVGDRAQVELEFDREYRNGPMHPMPASFRAALAKNPAAKKAWGALIPSRKKEVLRYFAGVKSPEARARNFERAIHMLSGKPGRFMGREWKDGK